tara:strand:+ start:1571 stop:1726 length:156 start_codon:yes stop_codon:yes gene_type:complete
MLKMELHEVNAILAIIENTQFSGKDIPTMASIIDKLQAESVKLAKGADGKK